MLRYRKNHSDGKIGAKDPKKEAAQCRRSRSRRHGPPDFTKLHLLERSSDPDWQCLENISRIFNTNVEQADLAGDDVIWTARLHKIASPRMIKPPLPPRC
jgi:hypothetical protein